MPSTTRGSILISTANDIGEALVEKLGGVGYSPNEWKDKFNLCGIAQVDSAPALSVLSDSAGTGDERGSILIATADAIGAILNKKYNVLRGFKPKEWASACRKMKALEEGSVASASIASFSDGADTVPIKSWKVEIPPTLTGKSAIECTQTGKNLFDISTATNGQINGTNGVYYANANWQASDFFPVHGANLTLSWDTDSSNYYQVNLAFYDSEEHYVDGSSNTFANIYSKTFTIPNGAVYCRASWSISVGGSPAPRNNIRINLGSTDRGYTPYTSPTQYNVNLGRTIYGGTADIIKGEGKETSARVKISDLTWSIQTVSGRSAFVSGQVTGLPTTSPKNVLCDVLTYDGEKTIGAMTDKTLVTWTNTFRVYDTDCEDVTEFLNTYGNGFIVYQLVESAQVDFTFEPVKIDSFPGVNNIWNDCGNTAVEYYKAPTPYTRKTATGGIANFSDQRTDLPLTKAIANIAPSIAGKSAVNLVRAGKNLFDKSNPNEIDGYITTTGFSTSNTSTKTVYIPIVGGATYTVSKTAGQRFQIATAEVEPTNNALFTNRQAGNTSTSLTITASANDKYLWAWVFLDGTDSGTLADMLNSVQIEVGSSASTYVPYQAPTTYTAELGETVYGGSVDFVSGEVNNEYGMITFDGSSDESWLYSDAYGWFYIDNQFGDAYRNNSESDFMICNLGTQSPYVSVASLPDLHFACTSGTNSRFAFKNSQYSTVEAFKEWLSNNPMIVVYKLATPIESTIPGRVISPIEGVNNYWNDAGGDTEIQYFEDET